MLIDSKLNHRWPYIPAAFTHWAKRPPAMWGALNDNMDPVERHNSHNDEDNQWREDDSEDLSEADKILREAAILESIAKRLMAGEDIDWDAEA